MMKNFINFFSYLINLSAKIFHVKPQFIKFLLVGGLNTLVGYAFFSFFIFLGFGDILAPLFANFFGILFNFKTYGHIVFKNTDNRLIFKFFAVYAILYVCNVVGLIAFAKAGLENRYISGFILLLPIAFLGFYLNKKYVFKRNTNELT